MFKVVMASAAALGVVMSSAAASAEPVRSSAALPGVVSMHKFKVARTSAPVGRESNAKIYEGDTLWVSAFAFASAGVAGYFLLRDDNGKQFVSTGG